MGLETISTAPGPFIPLDELKAQLRVEHDDEDTLIESHLAAAVDYFASRCHIAVAATTFKLTLDRFPAGKGAIDLLRPPTQAVQSISYIDTEGNEQTLPESDYRLDKGVRPGRILPQFAWPDTSVEPLAVSVTYTAGFMSSNEAPALLTQGIKLLVGHFYEQRGATSDREAKRVPFALDAIVNRYSYAEVA